MSVLRRLTFLLRPGWLILAAVVVAFAYLCFSVLAPWQLGKHTRTSHRNHAITASMTAAPLDVLAALDNPASPNLEWRRVNASGSYVRGTTVAHRLQRLDDRPAVGVLTLFRLTDGRVVLVDRGLVASEDSAGTPPIADPPPGAVTLEGRIRASEGIIAGKDPIDQDGYHQVYSIDTDQLASLLATPLTTFPAGPHRGYLQLSANQPGVFTPRPLPQLEAGPYLSYGLQWIAFGIMAPLGLGYFAYTEWRERRRPRPEPSPMSAPQTTAERLADRYGTRR